MYLLEFGWQTLSVEDQSKPLEKVIKAHQKELGLPGGNKVFEELTVRSSQGILDPQTTYPQPEESYTITLDHKSKA